MEVGGLVRHNIRFNPQFILKCLYQVRAIAVSMHPGMRMLRKEEEEGTNVMNLHFVRFSVIDCVFHLRLLPWCSVILLLSVFIENIN